MEENKRNSENIAAHVCFLKKDENFKKKGFTNGDLSVIIHPVLGPVVQSVSTPACHAGGRQFESVPGRHNVLRRE